jgi:hypothetical protein
MQELAMLKTRRDLLEPHSPFVLVRKFNRYEGDEDVIRVRIG